MKKINIIRTNGKCEDILKEYENDVIHLFIASTENLKSESDHELGDLLLSDVSETRFALLVKEYLSGKIISEALRVSIIELLSHIRDEKMNQKYILISSNEFGSSREEIMFLCTFKEILNMYFSTNTEEEKDISIIITDYKN